MKFILLSSLCLGTLTSHTNQIAESIESAAKILHPASVNTLNPSITFNQAERAVSKAKFTLSKMPVDTPTRRFRVIKQELKVRQAEKVRDSVANSLPKDWIKFE